MSKINRGSGVLVVLRGLWRRGSVRERRVQVRGGVRRPHTLPYEVRGARGGGFSSGFVYLLAHGARRDWSARHPGPTAVSRVRFRLDCGSGGSCFWRHENPSTLPSWTHEDTSVHARERDRSPEERRPLGLTAAVMRLHSHQVCLITRRQTWLFQRPSSLTHPFPSGAWWRAALKDRVMMMIKGGGSHSSQ